MFFDSCPSYGGLIRTLQYVGTSTEGCSDCIPAHLLQQTVYVHTVTARVSVPVVELKGCKKNESREVWALVQKHTSFKAASHTGGLTMAAESSRSACL
jgi:hypothetical protein